LIKGGVANLHPFSRWEVDSPHRWNAFKKWNGWNDLNNLNAIFRWKV
jgi:hypothetical protein